MSHSVFLSWHLWRGTLTAVGRIDYPPPPPTPNRQHPNLPPFHPPCLPSLTSPPPNPTETPPQTTNNAPRRPSTPRRRPRFRPRPTIPTPPERESRQGVRKGECRSPYTPSPKNSLPFPLVHRLLHPLAAAFVASTFFSALLMPSGLLLSATPRYESLRSAALCDIALLFRFAPLPSTLPPQR